MLNPSAMFQRRPADFTSVEAASRSAPPSALSTLCSTCRTHGTREHNVRVIFLCPDVVDDFQANVNVTNTFLHPWTSEEFVQFSRLQVKKLSGMAELERDEPACKHQGGRLIEWTNMQTPVLTRVIQQVVCSNQNGYVITGTALHRNVDEYRDVFQSIFDSFHIRV